MDSITKTRPISYKYHTKKTRKKQHFVRKTTKPEIKNEKIERIKQIDKNTGNHQICSKKTKKCNQTAIKLCNQVRVKQSKTKVPSPKRKVLTKLVFFFNK